MVKLSATTTGSSNCFPSRYPRTIGRSYRWRGRRRAIHIGQAVLVDERPIDYFVDTVFNYPTLAECYKNAAFDGINRLSA